MSYTANNIIGIDIDGCIANLTKYALPLINKQLGTNYTENDWVEYRGEHCFLPDAANVIGEIVHEPTTYLHLEPIDGAVPAIRHLTRAAEIWFITSRPESCKDATIHWLNRYDVPYKQLIFAKAKHLWVAAYHINAMVEDNLEIAQKCAEHCHLSIVLDRPWNRQSDKGVVRCKDWTQVLRVLLEKL